MTNIEKKEISPQEKNLLKMLCILTFIGSGFAFISYLLIGINYNYFYESIETFPIDDIKESMYQIFEGDKLFFIINSFLFLISLIGAIAMWNFKKLGFHMYTTAQLLILIAPLIFVPSIKMPITSALITLVFIWAYSRFLKYMN